MSECISREERAFLHALARSRHEGTISCDKLLDDTSEALLLSYGPTPTLPGFRGDMIAAAKAHVASLEAAPPAPICECGATGPHQAHSACAPKPGRVEERTFRVGRKVGRTIYEGDDLIGVMDTTILATMVVTALNKFHGDSLTPNQARTYFNAWQKERAEHEELRRRIERALEEAIHAESVLPHSTYMIIRKILKGEET